MKTAARVRSSTPSPAPTPAISAPAAPRTASRPAATAAAFTINASTGAVTLTGEPRTSRRSRATASPSWPPTRPATAANARSRWRSTTWTRWRRRSPPAPPPPRSMKTAEQTRSFTPSPAPTPAISAPAAPRTASSRRRRGAFSINASTGAVTLTGNPNFETKSSYNFTVVATDAAAQQQRTGGLARDQRHRRRDPARGRPTLHSRAQSGRRTASSMPAIRCRVTVTMSENTVVNTSGGTPSIELSIGGDRVDAGYVSGSGTASLIFAIHDSAG